MHPRPDIGRVDERTSLSMLMMLAAFVVVMAASRAGGLCIVFRLARRAIPGCVPAWSADRAPPRLLVIAA
ncbi:hypothetical protein [Actinoplanes sp. NBRC 103695]|jgi:hypothetical protein|uniref:hypothetical protein n=1 Tax=Actinoplanes sp. NBRC 103695 TaxID=3032202 RepID=UPI0024A0A983|nr:hypothetical protein [Actinoplanes sp. NBRC 103695]GLZ02114.1 hypothetical protein Acsp02_93650 [Actinoplanes sp. NBRC 103695]